LDIRTDTERLLQVLEQQQSELIEVVEDLKKSSKRGNLKHFLKDVERLKFSNRYYRLRHNNRLNALSKETWLNFEQSCHLRLAKAQNECIQTILEDVDRLLENQTLSANIGEYLYTQVVGPMEFELEKLAPLYAQAMQTSSRKTK